jgi:hypothetical protein
MHLDEMLTPVAVVRHSVVSVLRTYVFQDSLKLIRPGFLSLRIGVLV